MQDQPIPDWEIDILGRRAFPRPGYLRGILQGSQSLPLLVRDNDEDLHVDYYQNPKILFPEVDLASISISSVALSTARELFREKHHPSPMQCRRLKKRFRDVAGLSSSHSRRKGINHSSRTFHAGGNPDSKWQGGSTSNVQQIDQSITEILSTVSSIKQIGQELKDVNVLLSEARGVTVTASQEMLHDQSDQHVKMRRRRSLLDISLQMSPRTAIDEKEASSSTLKQNTDFMQEPRLRVTYLRSRLLPIDYCRNGNSTASTTSTTFELTEIHASRFSHQAAASKKYTPNSSAASAIPPNVLLSTHQQSSSVQSQRIGELSAATKERIFRESKLLSKDLEATKSLLSHHLYPHLASAHQGDLIRSRMWFIVVALANKFVHLHDTYKRKKLRVLMLSGKNRVASKIQKCWKDHRAFEFEKAIAAKEENARLMRLLALVLRCRWRAKSAAKIRQFCIDYSTISRFGTAVRNYRFRICRIQQMMREFMVCKNARVKALSRRWLSVESTHSWSTATAIKSCFYFLAQSSKEEREELARRKVQRKKEIERELSKQRPKLNLRVFRVGRPPREAQHKLRVGRRSLPQEKIDQLEKQVQDYNDRASMAQLAKNFNESLNRVGRLSDMIEMSEQGQDQVSISASASASDTQSSHNRRGSRLHLHIEKKWQSSKTLSASEKTLAQSRERKKREVRRQAAGYCRVYCLCIKLFLLLLLFETKKYIYSDPC